MKLQIFPSIVLGIIKLSEWILKPNKFRSLYKVPEELV